jgi:Na+/melibiose symporter-like transporter
VLPLEAQRLFPDSPARALILMLGAVMLAQIAMPAAGLWSDNVHSQLGKRRPVILVGTSLCLVTLTLCWYCSLTQTRLSLFFLVLLINQVGWNTIMAAHNGLVADTVASGQGNVGTSSGLSMAFMVGGSGLGVVGCLLFASLDFHLNYGLIALMLVVTVATVWFNSEEAPSYPDPTSEAQQRPTREVMLSLFWIDYNRYPNCFLVFATRCAYFAAHAPSTYLLYLLRDCFDLQDSYSQRMHLTKVVFATEIPAVCAAGICGLLIRHNSMKMQNVVWFGSALMGVLLPGFALMANILSASKDPTLLMAIGAGFGLGHGAYLAGDYSLAITTMQYDGASETEASRLLGFVGTACFVGGMISTPISSALIETFGQMFFPPTPPAVYSVQGYWAVFLLGSAFAIATSMLSMRIRTVGDEPEQATV